MRFNFRAEDLKDPVTRKMLSEAIEAYNQRELPLHRRGKKAEADEGPDDDTTDQDDENDKLVELHQARGTPAPIPVTDEDLPETVASKMVSRDKKKGKK